ncbi:MAG TPA: hypothetical protein VEL47_00370 [Myxococcota bacterium]|nr:hypothetical protein [Myxococcota bacterium]
MNNMTKHALRFSALLLVGASLYLTGCGPENLDDAAYFAELSDNSAVVDSAAQNAVMPRPTMGKPAMANGNGRGMAGRHDADRNGHQMRGQHMRGADMRGGMYGGMYGRGGAAVEGVQGVPGYAAGIAMPAVGQVAQLPDTFVELPAVLDPQVPVVTNTGELRNYNRRILHEQKVFVDQPMVNQHLITNNLNTERIYHTTVINRPSFREDVAVAQTFSVTPDVVTPTTVVTEPTAVLPGVAAVAPVVAPAVGVGLPYNPLYNLGYGFGMPLGCNPYYSGGFARFCY